MAHKLAVFVLAFCLAACSARPVQQTECPAATSAPEVQPSAPLSAPPLQPAQTPTPPQNNAPQANVSAAKTASANTLKTTAPQKEASSAAARELSPTQRIAALRGRQAAAQPTPDSPSFEDEEIISLENRRLSPLAYEPVSDEKTTAPWTGEQLKYGLYYSFIKAGTAYIKTRGVTQINGRTAYVIQTTAFSAPVIDAFFKVRDINYSWLDAENFYSLGYSQSVREGNYKRDEWLAFDYSANVYYGEVQKKAEPRLISGALTAPVLDMLTSLYFVRAQRQLTPGKDVVFDIVNREKQYPLIVKVLKKETVKTAAGKFNCIVVEPQFRGEGIFVSKGKSLKVWLTDDEYKMPVKMKTEVFIGSVSAELLEYKRN